MNAGLSVDLDVITPSYAPDFELCADLNASVLRHGGGRVRHTIIVPPKDLSAIEKEAYETLKANRSSDPRSNLKFVKL